MTSTTLNTKTITLKRNYMLAHVTCESGKHPDLEILMPISKTLPYVLQKQVCPSCYSKDVDIVRGYAEPYIVQIEDTPRDANARRTRENGSPKGTILYTLKCKRCDEVSLIKPEGMRWKDKLEIKACPVCGFDKYRVKGKFDVELTLTPQNGATEELTLYGFRIELSRF